MKSALSKGKIGKSMISSSQFGSFKHIAHIGYDADTEWSSEGIDPSLVALFEDLEGKGVSRKIIQREIEYIKSFVRDAQDAPKQRKKPPPPFPPSQGYSAPSNSVPQRAHPASPRPKFPRTVPETVPSHRTAAAAAAEYPASPQSGSSKHIAHIGYDAETGWSSEGVDPSFIALFEDLEGKGVSRKIIQREIEYIKSFVRDAQDAPKRKTKPQPSPAPHRRSRIPSTDLHLQVKPPSPSPAPMNRQYNS